MVSETGQGEKRKKSCFLIPRCTAWAVSMVSVNPIDSAMAIVTLIRGINKYWPAQQAGR